MAGEIPKPKPESDFIARNDSKEEKKYPVKFDVPEDATDKLVAKVEE